MCMYEDKPHDRGGRAELLIARTEFVGKINIILKHEKKKNVDLHALV